MPEIRRNALTAETVIIAPERAKRPTAHKETSVVALPYQPGCPFCPGQEGQTPPAVLQYPASGPWEVRVVPNKFSALDPNAEPWSEGEGLHQRSAASGLHEVIIEGQLHNARLQTMSSDARKAVLLAWQMRMQDLFSRSHVAHVLLFKNHGPAAGSSLDHPHSQIVGLPIVPGRFEYRRHLILDHHQRTGRCLVCDVLRNEVAAKERIVCENEAFVAFIPFAALSPFHVWIVPKTHGPSYASIGAKERDALEAILSSVLIAVDRVALAPDFNLMFMGGHPHQEKDRGLHWYVSVVARTTKAAGFELGTGMFINPSSPEINAELLRQSLAEQ